MLRSIFTLVVLFSVSSIRAESYTWKNVTVGAGGFIPGIVFSPIEKNLAYLRSDIGGFYRWDESAKQWIPLNDAMPQSGYHGGESIAPDPRDANIVYAAAGMYRSDPAAMLRSRDRGKTWEVFPVPFRMGGNEDGRGAGERLAIDPNDTSILYFGSRHDGLQISTDHAEHWHKVESFPIQGLGLPAERTPTHAGLSFVIFDPNSGRENSKSRTIFVGNADPGEHHLFRSDDAGESWKALAGEPSAELLPLKAAIDDAGILYITYSNNAGPNGATQGAVFSFDTKSNLWTDITPQKNSGGGYCGISLDRQHPGALGVTTLNRWNPVDTVWRSVDGGKTWNDIAAKSARDVSATPFLLWGDPQAKLGWWMAAFAIDPFDSDHAVYATGATVYATNDFSNVSSNEPTHWLPWVKGIEQTAIITLCSPTGGAHLLSGFGDIGGFVHDDLDQSPQQGMFTNPRFNNTETIDYAANKPEVIVRSGRPHEQGEASLAFSEDGGKTWQPIELVKPETTAPTRRRRREATPAIVVSADGSTFVVTANPPKFTIDRGKTWRAIDGLPPGGRPVPDRVDPKKFYSLDFDSGKTFISDDGAKSFTQIDTAGLPQDIKSDRPTWSEAAWPLHATLSKSGDLWFVSKSGLFHSSDAGKTFSKTSDDLHVDALSFGKAPQGKDYPALFAIGTRGESKAIWRSDDAGQSWLRVNDDEHQYGTRFRCLVGDPRVFSRVYVGTDGRGILHGERN